VKTRLYSIIYIAVVNSCVNYEPRVLSPDITLSDEEVILFNPKIANQNIDFGLDVGTNESESLFNLETLPGVKVRTIENGSNAEKSGIRVGDILLKIDQIDINTPDSVRTIEKFSGPKEFIFRLQRDSTVFETTVIANLIETATPIELYRVDPIATRAAYTSHLLSIENQSNIVAARIEELFEKTTLPSAGLNVGDMILALEGVPINSAQDLVTRLNREHTLGSEVTIDVYSDGELKSVKLELFNPGRRISRLKLAPLISYESDLTQRGIDTRLKLFNFWFVSAYQYSNIGGEKRHSILGLLEIASDLGELAEENQ
jgi:S1-C subfamily serine protease|tara:strand:+ start:4192 stop:5139 length:948 start_codon:yes stop_codon:yes gene_type:complete